MVMLANEQHKTKRDGAHPCNGVSRLPGPEFAGLNPMVEVFFGVKSGLHVVHAFEATVIPQSVVALSARSMSLAHALA